MSSQRSQRRRRSAARLVRRSPAMDCYYTGVNMAPTADQQLARICRGAAEIVVEAELRGKLERSLRTGTPLKVKLGLDPTAPDLHLGHTVVLQKLRDFQDLGHQVIIIIGDFTGMIGDPTGRSETRRPLTWEEIRENAETYKAQLGKVLDMGRTQVRFNSEWLAPLTFEQIIRETAHLTVARILQREDFAARYAAGRPISLHEFLYPLAQGYDSVALEADVELGGTDQTFNLLVGRELQRHYGQEPQCILTLPLLQGLDGVEKMSKSKNNYIGITEPPSEMFGKIMRISDDLMWRYYELTSSRSLGEIEAFKREVAGGRNPRDVKVLLGQEIVARFHSPQAAELALQDFEARFRQGEAPADMPQFTFSAQGKGGIVVSALLKQAGLAPSSSEAIRAIEQGGVRIDGQRIADRTLVLTPGTYVLQVGKRRWARVTLT